MSGSGPKCTLPIVVTIASTLPISRKNRLKPPGAVLPQAFQLDHPRGPQMIQRIVNAAAMLAFVAIARIVELEVFVIGLVRGDHAVIDDCVARLERQQQMVAAHAAVEAGETVARFG